MTKATDRAAISDALRAAKHQIVFLQALYCKDKVPHAQQIDKVLQKINVALAVIRADEAVDND
jgi:hypothetical protein